MSTIFAASTARQESRPGTTLGKGYYSPNVRVDGLPWSDVFSILTSPWGCIIKRGMLNFLSEDKTVYYTKLLLERAEQDGETIRRAAHRSERRPGVRADQAHRAQLIARSIISSGCLSLVKSVFGFVVCSFEYLCFKVVCYLCTRATALCCLYCTGLCRKYYLHKATFVCKCTSTIRFLFIISVFS